MSDRRAARAGLVVLLIAALAACGGNDESQPGPTSPPQTYSALNSDFCRNLVKNLRVDGLADSASWYVTGAPLPSSDGVSSATCEVEVPQSANSPVDASPSLNQKPAAVAVSAVLEAEVAPLSLIRDAWSRSTKGVSGDGFLTDPTTDPIAGWWSKGMRYQSAADLSDTAKELRQRDLVTGLNAWGRLSLSTTVTDSDDEPVKQRQMDAFGQALLQSMGSQLRSASLAMRHRARNQ